MSADTVSADVTVVGAGMGGLVAAIRAQEQGADVVLLEKGSRFGGSMFLSTGAVWTYDSFEEFRENVPDADSALQRLIADTIEFGYEWLEEHGVELTEPDLDLPGGGRKFDPPTFTDRMVGIFEDNGGQAHLETPMDELRVEDGRVTGMTAYESDGSRRVIDCDSVVVATGGFQGNEEFVEQFITTDTENLVLRANPWSTGDGFQAAKEVGAKTTNGLGKFYGHSLPAPPAEFSQTEFSDVSQYYGPVAVALDRSGKRFTDESESKLEAVLIQDVVEHTDGRAYYVLDSDICVPHSKGLSDSAEADIENAKAAGGRVAECDSLTELGERLSEWDVSGGTAVETIREYNEAIRAGEAENLDPPRRNYQCVLDTPPFYAVEIQPGITYTMGGLSVDTRMRVQRRTQSTATYGQRNLPERDDRVSTKPIPGLYAAGVDVGNIHHRTSSGGLSQGLVTGLVAGREAAMFATE